MGGKYMPFPPGIVLLGADIVLFPTLYLSDSLCLGIMQRRLLARGSCFDVNNTTIWSLLVVSIGRYLGPCVARRDMDDALARATDVSEHGQNAYAAQQVLASVFFLVFFEVAVRPVVGCSAGDSATMPLAVSDAGAVVECGETAAIAAALTTTRSSESITNGSTHSCYFLQGGEHRRTDIEL